MSTAIEKLCESGLQTILEEVGLPIIRNQLAARGHEPQNEKQAEIALQVANLVGEQVLSGGWSPIPMRELEQDGSLSKHATEKVQNDPLAFAPTFDIDVDKLDNKVKAAAAKLLLVSAKAHE